MSEAEYIEAQNDIAEAINEYGRTVSLVYQQSTGDPWNPINVDIPTDIKAIVSEFKGLEINNSVLSTDIKLLAGTEDIQKVIDVGGDLTAMHIIDRGKSLSIISSVEIAPGDTILAYRLQCRV